MSNRINGYIVILEQDCRDDNAKATLEAIKRIKGVLDVKENISTADEIIAETRIRQEFKEKLWKLITSNDN